jgi:hypothetical protein
MIDNAVEEGEDTEKDIQEFLALVIPRTLSDIPIEKVEEEFMKL